jgi:BASS family bile acid:Na+ symporter
VRATGRADRRPVVADEIATASPRQVNVLRRYLTLWLILSSGAALFWPDVAELLGLSATNIDPFRLGSRTIKWAIVLTMLCIGGLLPVEEIKQVARQWPAVVFGTTTQYLVMPTLAWLAVTLTGLTGDLRIGVLIVGAVPGAMASNVLTLVARGNVSYSIALTTSATLLSPIVVPLALKLTAGTEVSDATLIGMGLDLLWTVVLPVLAGYAICRWSSRCARMMELAGESIANLSILWIIAFVVGLQREYLLRGSAGDDFGTVLLGLAGINILGYLIGYWAGVAVRLSVPMRRALSIEVGMQNAGVGTALAMAALSPTTVATIPTALYTFGCMLTGTLLAQAFARWRSDPDVGTPTEKSQSQSKDPNAGINHN